MSRSIPFGVWLAAMVAVLVAVVWLIDSHVPIFARAFGAATVLLAVFPGLRYLTDLPPKRRPFPFLPVVGLIYGIYFGVPFLFGLRHRVGGGVTVQVGPELVTAASLAMVGWIFLLATYWISGHLIRPRPWDLSRLASDAALVRTGLLLVGLGLLQKFATVGVSVPIEFAGPMGLLGRLSWVGAGFLVAAWSSGQLSTGYKLLTLIAVLLISGVEIGTGSVANPGRFWLLLLLAAWIGHEGTVPRRWWVAGGAVLLALMVLRGSVMEYRQRAWYGADLGAKERLAVYLAVLENRFEARGIRSVLAESAETVGNRVSQATVLADVVGRTPEYVPYWSGETYVSLVGAFIPRFLWPAKPVKNLGQRFGHRYSYLHPQDTWTSFNFPFLVEFYANFGPLGVVFGMALVGFIYRLLDDLLNPIASGGTIVARVLALGLLVPVMTAVESDFSLVFGGLILNGVALYAVLCLLTRKRRIPLGAREQVLGHP